MAVPRPRRRRLPLDQPPLPRRPSPARPGRLSPEAEPAAHGARRTGPLREQQPDPSGMFEQPRTPRTRSPSSSPARTSRDRTWPMRLSALHPSLRRPDQQVGRSSGNGSGRRRHRYPWPVKLQGSPSSPFGSSTPTAGPVLDQISEMRESPLSPDEFFVVSPFHDADARSAARSPIDGRRARIELVVQQRYTHPPGRAARRLRRFAWPKSRTCPAESTRS